MTQTSALVRTHDDETDIILVCHLTDHHDPLTSSYDAKNYELGGKAFAGYNKTRLVKKLS